MSTNSQGPIPDPSLNDLLALALELVNAPAGDPRRASLRNALARKVIEALADESPEAPEVPDWARPELPLL